MSLQGCIAAIHRRLERKKNTLGIAKYAETVNYWSSYAFDDGHRVRKSITHDT